MGGRGSFERPKSSIQTRHRDGYQSAMGIKKAEGIGSALICRHGIEGASFSGCGALVKLSLSESEFLHNAKLTLCQAFPW
jgi:hypothetical protein